MKASMESVLAPVPVLRDERMMDLQMSPGRLWTCGGV